jgi:drug/metabolite transporter (DMT)-like permease
MSEGETEVTAGRRAILRGIAWMVAAAFFYAMASGVVRWLAADYHALELVFFRNVMSVLVLAPMMWRVGLAGLATRRLGLHSLRMCFSYIGTMSLFLALAHMPIADVSALIFTQPLMTIVLAILVLRQSAGPRTWIACAVGFSGALIILRPGFAAFSAAGLFALAAAFTYACATTTIKSLSRTESTLLITVSVNVLMLPLSAVSTVFVWKNPALADLPGLFLLGALYVCAQWTITKAVGAADARVVQPFDFLRLPFAALIGYLAFRELPDSWTWIGAAVIFAAATYVMRHETGRRAR